MVDARIAPPFMEATDASRLAWREQPSLPLRSSLAPLPFRQSRGILYGPSQPPHRGTMKYTAIVNLLAASLRKADRVEFIGCEPTSCRAQSL